MRFPLSLTRSMAGYLIQNRLAGQARVPLVLMLEPLFACNLRCSGCGRVREYADCVHDMLSLDECLAAVDECGSPVVSICGGEPLMYPGIEDLVRQIVARRKHVYLCTNGLLLEKKLPGLRPSSRLAINVHLDGLEALHDRIVEREGVFQQAVAGIQAAKQAGFRVCTNTTVYRQTEMREIALLLEHLTRLGVDGFMLSPAYGYEAVQSSDGGAGRFFMTRDECRAKFREARPLLRRFKLTASPIYLDFLCGARDLACAAWASPTRNVRGWKGPCYLITDRHYATYGELAQSTAWDKLGPSRDPRCEHCLVHCGFEPAAVFASPRSLRDAVAMAAWQLG